MNNLCTKSDVVTLAFQRPINENRIEDSLIASIQLKYIKPILGRDFYYAVLTAPLSYPNLLPLIKPIIAHYCRYHLLPEIFTEVSNTGVNKINGNNRSAGTSEDLGSLRQATLDVVLAHSDTLTEYLNENQSSYPLYYPGSNPGNRISFAGGIIIKNEYPDEFFTTEND